MLEMLLGFLGIFLFLSRDFSDFLSSLGEERASWTRLGCNENHFGILWDARDARDARGSALGERSVVRVSGKRFASFSRASGAETANKRGERREVKKKKRRRNERKGRRKNNKKKRKKTTTTRRNKRRNRRKNEVHRPRNARLVRCWPVSARIGCIFFILPSFST